MNTTQSNKMAMYLATQEVCEQYHSVWKSIPASSTVFGEYERLLQQLKDALRKQEAVYKGITQDKGKLREAMTNEALMLIDLLKLHATRTSNLSLLERINYNKSDFTHTPATVAKERAEIVHTAARGLLTDLAPYSVTKGKVDNFRKAISNYEGTIATTRAAINGRREATQSIVKLVKQIDLHLKYQLDPLMGQFRGHEFYTTYKSARVIVNRKGKVAMAMADTGETPTTKENPEIAGMPDEKK